MKILDWLKGHGLESMSTDLELDDNEKSGRERRRYRRKNVVNRQLVTVALGDGKTAILIDVSEDGIAVQPMRPLKLGSRLNVEFALPRGAGFIQGLGDVVWVGRSGRAGIRFAHLAQRSWCDLDRWLRVVEDPLAEAIKNYSQRREANADEVDSDERLDLQTVLDLITERACTATNADGAAFVVESAGEFVCCSSLGDAPEIGVMVKPESITGECLRHGVSVMCGDIYADPRANVAGTRYAVSVVAVPILAESRVIGGIVVTSAKRDAFTERDTGRLKRLAEIASKLADDLRAETAVQPSSEVVVEISDKESLS